MNRAFGVTKLNSIIPFVTLLPLPGQIPRALGLAYASKLFRNNPELSALTNFSHNGNEIVFATIGDASTSQGMFWETMNAAGVLQVPLLMSVWDDGYGISVPVEYQTVKGDISKALAGFQRDADDKGFEIFTVKGWDYVALLETYQRAAHICRTEHVPVLVHVQELTQPQGHSTSGSQERYKSKQRLAWEAEHDCNRVFRLWVLENGYATNEELETIEAEAKQVAKKARMAAWNDFEGSMKADFDEALDLLQQTARHHAKSAELMAIRGGVTKNVFAHSPGCGFGHTQGITVVTDGFGCGSSAIAGPGLSAPMPKTQIGLVHIYTANRRIHLCT